MIAWVLFSVVQRFHFQVRHMDFTSRLKSTISSSLRFTTSSFAVHHFQFEVHGFQFKVHQFQFEVHRFFHLFQGVVPSMCCIMLFQPTHHSSQFVLDMLFQPIYFKHSIPAIQPLYHYTAATYPIFCWFSKSAYATKGVLVRFNICWVWEAK